MTWLGHAARPTAPPLQHPAHHPLARLSEEPAERQGGEDAGQVGFERVAQAVVDGPGLKVALGRPEGFLGADAASSRPAGSWPTSHSLVLTSNRAPRTGTAARGQIRASLTAGA
jgi:hypothetical protein